MQRIEQVEISAGQERFFKVTLREGSVTVSTRFGDERSPVFGE
jgi:hypothetical protein